MGGHTTFDPPTQAQAVHPRQVRLQKLTGPQRWDQPVVGLMLRHPWRTELLAQSDTLPIDWLEVYPENYQKRGPRLLGELETLAAQWPLTSHGVHLSLGGLDPLSEDYLTTAAAFFDRFDIPWCSDHLGVSVHRGEILHEIVPPALTRDAAWRIAERSAAAQARFGRPLLVENTAAYLRPPGSDLDEPDFIHAVLERSDVHLLLDVNNLYVNALNHGLDASQMLRRLPLDRVREIHIGGFTVQSHSGLVVDSHAAAPTQPVWRLLVEALGLCGPVPVLLEWESHFGCFSQVRAQIEQVHTAWRWAAAQATTEQTV
ncbi:MAG: DUF692 domain-containing protein [Polyangiales bacterium]